MTDLYGLEAFSPPEIARRVTEVGVRKARLTFLPTAVLRLLGGAFIGLGALYFTLVTSDPALSYAWGQLLGGVVFSLGLILVILAGAELFTQAESINRERNDLGWFGPSHDKQGDQACQGKYRTRPMSETVDGFTKFF